MARKTNEQTEAVEATTEQTAEQVPAEETIDLTAFEAAVVEAIEARDESTGTVPEINVDAVRTAYRELPGAKPKNAGKAYLQKVLEEALESLNVTQARAAMQLIEHGAVAGRAPSAATPKKQVDPTEGYAENIAALTLALWLAQQNGPEGVDLERAVTEGNDKASELFNEATAAADSDEKPENKIVARAIKLATAKVTRRGGGGSTYAGPRRDIARHIGEAIAGVEAGTFLSVAELRAFKSEEYGEDSPSAGAIANRLEPTSGKPTTIEGVVVERRELDGRSKLGVVVQ